MKNITTISLITCSLLPFLGCRTTGDFHHRNSVFLEALSFYSYFKDSSKKEKEKSRYIKRTVNGIVVIAEPISSRVSLDSDDRVVILILPSGNVLDSPAYLVQGNGRLWFTRHSRTISDRMTEGISLDSFIKECKNSFGQKPSPWTLVGIIAEVKKDKFALVYD